METLKMCLDFYKDDKNIEKRFIKAMRSALFTGSPIELKGFGRFSLTNKFGVLSVEFTPDHDLLLCLNDCLSSK